MKLDSNTRDKLLSIILGRIDLLKKKQNVVTVELVTKVVGLELEFNGDPFDDEDVNRLVHDVEYYAKIKHSSDCVIYDAGGIQNWYSELEEQNGEFWRLYRRYLEQTNSLDRNSINKLEQETLPKLMNCLTDPKEYHEGNKLRRGLVIGDVQSGKTSTYTGLICKAADAGYKVVILLTGITETLRKQTQERMEEGIIGYTVRRIKRGTKGAKKTDVVGVGHYEHTITATAFTSYEDDFKGDVDTIATTLKSHKSLVMFVVKKNVKILEKLYNWLATFNKDVLDDMIHAPMLLIDDEADNASINTSKDKYDPTKTNKIIRKLCNAFNKCTYVGFTATPFANVFIDPETTKDMVNSDLFPEHFIYVLPTPSSYIGAKKLFNPEESLSQKCLKYITDITEPSIEELQDEENPDTRPLYYKHTKNWHGTFPSSLTDAIRCFYLTNVIRDLRGDNAKPRTMMINVSRFVKVHSHILEYVQNLYNNDYKTILTDFDNNSINNRHLPLFVSLKNLYEQHFKDCGCPINEVLKKKNILNGIEKILVLKVNSKKGSDKLDYKENPSLRCIAIGGLSLSRGLTLEGLVVSYFYRNTSTFDVLMQMGRWFGYRKNYEDICQIWTSQSSANWYKLISDSTEELKEELQGMYEDNLTPKEFGIRVHDVSEELQITSSNKMRHSFTHDELLDFWGGLFETPYVNTKIENNKENLKWVNYLLANIKNDGGLEIKQEKSDNNGTVLIRNVPRVYVDTLISNIRVSLKNTHFYMSEMKDFINDCHDKQLDKWDVVLFSGHSDMLFNISDTCQIRCLKRTISLMGDEKHIGFTGSAGRLGSKTDGLYAIKDNLSVEQISKIKMEYEEDRGAKTKEYPGNIWFKYVSERNPCLMLYLVRPSEETNREKAEMSNYVQQLGKDPVIGFGIGFPKCGSSVISRKKYKVNKTYLKQLMDESGEDDELS